MKKEDEDLYEVQIAQLKAKLKLTEENVKYWSGQDAAKQAELASIHRILDNVKNSPPRNNVDKLPENESWRAENYDIVERFAIWIAWIGGGFKS